MESEEIVALLNADIRGEHAAIIQYLLHAYAIGESDVACEIESISRDEMRHLKWLSELVVELGGDPTIERDLVDAAGAVPPEWMVHDIAAEDRAIALYREHIAAIDEPSIRLLLERIVTDELSHRGKFGGLGEELAAEGREPVGAIRAEDAKAGPSRPLEILLQGIQHEYTVILQYLYHGFTTPNCDIADELEWQAINEMQHMGWFGEEMAARGGYPALEHTAIDRPGETAGMLEADIAAERAVTAEYGAQIPELQAANEPGLTELFTLVRDHEAYHDALFSQLLHDLREEAPAEPGVRKPPVQWTVGSLHGQKQE